ncbi:MAG: C25 family cysteine peptidase [Candidatus Diapherotrites archaeon]
MILNFRHGILLLFFLILSTSALALNEKNMSMYQDGQVFMISDSDWRNVLSLVPLTTWTDLSTGEIHKYPTLAYKDQKEAPTLSLETKITWESGDGRFSKKPVITLQAKKDQDDWFSYFYTSFLIEEDSKYCDGTPVCGLKIGLIDYYFEKNIIKYGETVNAVLVFKSCDGEEHTLSEIELDEFPHSDFLQALEVPQELHIPAAGSAVLKIPLTYPVFQESFDADSALHFLGQYKQVKPNIKVTAILEQPQELLDLASAQGIPVEKLDAPWKYLSYWGNIDSVFVVDYDDYSSGLVASVAASYLNAPLFFVNKDNVDVFKYVVKNRVVLAVGDLDSETKTKLSIAASKYYAIPLIDLQKISAQVSGSDKLLMVNPTDLQEVGVIVKPEKSSGFVSGYTSASLAAPFLAAAKHEVLIPVYSSDYADVDAELDWRINYLGGVDKFKYLTIFATPDAITTNAPPWITADIAIYADINKNYLPDLATGRVYGITDTDVFSYVSRDLFYNELGISNQALIIHGYDPSLGMKGEAASVSKILSAMGLKTTSVYLDDDKDGYPYEELPPVSFLEEVSFASFHDHGNAAGWSEAYYSNDLQQEDAWFKSSIFLSDACSTCDYSTSFIIGTVDNLFCTQLIRRGALAHFGAIGVARSGWLLPTLLVSDLYSGLSLGTALKNNFENVLGNSGDSFASPYTTVLTSNFLLLGDPTLVWSDDLALSSLDKRELAQKITDNGNIELKLHLPSSFLIAQGSFDHDSIATPGFYTHHIISSAYTPPKAPYQAEELEVQQIFKYNDSDPEHDVLFHETVHGLQFCDRLVFSLPQGKKLGAPTLLSIKTGSQILTLGFDPFIPPISPEWLPVRQKVCSDTELFPDSPECYAYAYQVLIKNPCFKEENGPVKGCADKEHGFVGVYPNTMDGKYVVNFCMPSYLFPNPDVNMDDDSFPDYAPARDIIIEIELVDE